MDVVYLVLPGMAGLFFFWLFAKELVRRAFGFGFCVICATVSSTWLLLLVLKAAGYDIPLLIVAILMGESVAGLMYQFEKRVGRRGNLPALKPVIVLAGTLSVYLLLRFVYG